MVDLSAKHRTYLDQQISLWKKIHLSWNIGKQAFIVFKQYWFTNGRLLANNIVCCCLFLMPGKWCVCWTYSSTGRLPEWTHRCHQSSHEVRPGHGNRGTLYILLSYHRHNIGMIKLNNCTAWKWWQVFDRTICLTKAFESRAMWNPVC